MDGVVAFYLLVSMGLALWALVKSHRVESEMRQRLRKLEAERDKERRDVEQLRLTEPAPGGFEPASQPPPVRQPPRPVAEPSAVARPVATPRPPPVQPSVTPALDSAVAAALKWLSGGNVFVRIGVLVLFFGVAFLLKYASEHHALSPQVRLAGAVVTAVALLVAGWRLRWRTRGYALVLQGGGIGVLYLSVFASLRLYHLLPAGLVFLLLCAVAVSTVLLALIQDALWLAIMAALGGFLAPVLASTGDGSHVVLFSYYLVLNGAILWIAFRRAWRGLNVLGFVCTFVIASAWGALRYRHEFFATTEPFLIAFFLIYNGIAFLYALRQSVRLSYYADGTLIFGVPLVGFGLQSAMVHDWHYALAYSATALCAFYLALAAAIYRFRRRDLKVLMEAYLALGAGFGTLAIPFAFDAYWTSAAWALEGAGIAWSGMRQRRALLILSGLLVQVAGGIAFLLHESDGGTSLLMPVINSETLGVALIAIAGLFSAWYLDRSAGGQDAAAHIQRRLSLCMLIWGILWWAHGGLEETARLTPFEPVAHTQSLLLFASASLLLFSSASLRLRWNALGALGMLQTPVMLLALLWLCAIATHPAQEWGWLAWGLALPGSFLVLWQLERRRHPRVPLPLLHAVNLLVAIAVITWECDWQLKWPDDSVWRLPVSGVLPALALLALSTRAGRWLRWPVQVFAAAYTGWAAGALAAYLWFWLAATNAGTDSNGILLPYVPLLNPLDAAQVLVLLASARWLLSLRRGTATFGSGPLGIMTFKSMTFAAGLAAFICINSSLIRTLCYWLKLPFDAGMLMDSQVVQMSLSILWTSTALLLMISAARRRWRYMWFAGASLMAAEVVKLFALDLEGAGSLERIVSFIVVGGLLLLIGYFTPAPPAQA